MRKLLLLFIIFLLGIASCFAQVYYTNNLKGKVSKRSPNSATYTTLGNHAAVYGSDFLSMDHKASTYLVNKKGRAYLVSGPQKNRRVEDIISENKKKSLNDYFSAGKGVAKETFFTYVKEEVNRVQAVFKGENDADFCDTLYYLVGNCVNNPEEKGNGSFTLVKKVINEDLCYFEIQNPFMLDDYYFNILKVDDHDSLSFCLDTVLPMRKAEILSLKGFPVYAKDAKHFILVGSTRYFDSSMKAEISKAVCEQKKEQKHIEGKPTNVFCDMCK